MAKVLIIYGSTTGNTEWVSGEVGKQITAAGHQVEIKSAGKVSAEGLCQGQDMVLFGCSTWGMDELEFQEDFIPLFENFDKIDASGVKTSVFGCGDTDYEYYCGAVDAIADKLKDMGAEVVGDKLKIDGDPVDAESDIQTWTGSIIAAL